MKSKRIILDTNLWISFLISHDYSFLDKYIENGKISLIFSSELYSEFLSVSERPKFKKYFLRSDINHLAKIMNKFGTLVNVIASVDHCRDSKDNFLLNLAIDSDADYLVTGDTDLLEMESIGNTKIVPMRKLLEELS